MRAISIAWLLAAWQAVMGSGQVDPVLFTVDRSVDPARVSADRDAVAADQAIEQLAKALGWRLSFETQRVREELSLVSLDLSFEDQSPRIVAHLVAVAGGADVVFDDRTRDRKTSTTIHVVMAASSKSEAGRKRLRHWAMHWYRTFLSKDLQSDPLVEDNAMDVRMHLGHLMLEQGDLVSAVQVYKSVYDADQTHPYVPLAMLRMAQSYFDLRQFDEAETWARRISRMHPSRPETAAATVLLGRILIAGKRYDECVRTMQASLLPLSDTPTAIDIILLTAEAHRLRERQDQVYRQIQLCRSTPQFKEMSKSQWLDFEFLRGVGAEGTERWREGMEACELFVGAAPHDRRDGIAFTVLSRCYLALGKFVEAHAAARHALSLASQLDDEWSTQARILEARTAFILGDRKRAIADLEVEVRRKPLQRVELILFLVDTLIEEGLYQKAIANADLLAQTKGKWGDLARERRVLAMFKRAERASALGGFIHEALPYAKIIEDEALQSRVADLFGRAFEALGQLERAADAYRGLLR